MTRMIQVIADYMPSEFEFVGRASQAAWRGSRTPGTPNFVERPVGSVVFGTSRDQGATYQLYTISNGSITKLAKVKVAAIDFTSVVDGPSKPLVVKP